MNLKAAQVMTSDPTIIQVTNDLAWAYKIMKREGVRHLPVSDDQGNIVGIISDRDFQRAMWPIQKFSAGNIPSAPIFRAGATVSDFMSWPVKTVTYDTDLMAVVRIMIDEKISAVLITQNQELSGIVTYEDLLMVLAVYLKQPAPLKDRAVEWVYNSPIGKVASMLADAGL